MLEANVEQNAKCVMAMMDKVVRMDSTRKVDKLERIGRLVAGKPRPLRVMLKWLQGHKEILARTNMLKDV